MIPLEEHEYETDLFDELDEDFGASEEWEAEAPWAEFDDATLFSDAELDDEFVAPFLDPWLNPLLEPAKRALSGVAGLGRPPKLQKVFGPAYKKTVKPALARLRRRRRLSREKVCWIQTVLTKARQARLRPDGIYGPKTRSAVRRFQARYRLRVDGIVGPQTTAGLLQLALRGLGFPTIRVDGRPGPRTRRALKRFQSRAGLVADGILGPRTRTAMVRSLGGRCIPRRFRPRPTPPVTPKLPRKCDRADLDRRIKKCRKEFLKCTFGCHAGIELILDKIKLIPGLYACTKLPPKLALACASAVGGKALIDEYLRLLTCHQNCRTALSICSHVARVNSRCL